MKLQNKFGRVNNVSQEELVNALHETAKHNRQAKKEFIKQYKRKKNAKTS